MNQPATGLTRRRLLRWMAASAWLHAWMPTRLARALEAAHNAKDAVDPGGFEPVTGGLPAVNPGWLTPAVAPPPGSSSPVFDIFGNFWTLASADPQGPGRLLVLPAQAPSQWVEDDKSGLPPGAWRHIAADEFGYIWIADTKRCLRLDPHSPQAGWTDFSADLRGAAIRALSPGHEPAITALGTVDSGAVAAAVSAAEAAAQSGVQSGVLIELDREQQTTARLTPAPASVDRILCDERGDLWLHSPRKTYRKAAAADAWQRRWRMVDRLSAGNHDLSGDVLNGRFYMAGGQNAGWGYPAVPHVFRELLSFDPSTLRWSTVAQLDQPRYYNGTSFLDGRVWIIAGYTRDEKYNPVRLDSVTIWDPATGAFSAGPPLPMLLDNPVALHCDGRIYVAGCQLAAGSSPLNGPLRPCLLLSIGAEETGWRREPDGPDYLLALAGTVQDGKLCLALGGKGLGSYDTKSRTWSVVPVAHAARSPQVAAYHGEIWIMGGRDIERQDAVTIYSPATGSWRAGPDLPRPLAWGAAVEVGGRLMVVGGAAGRGYNNRTFVLRDPPLTT